MTVAARQATAEVAVAVEIDLKSRQVMLRNELERQRRKMMAQYHQLECPPENPEDGYDFEFERYHEQV